MKTISDQKLLMHYITKYDLKEFFCDEILQTMSLISLEKGEYVCEIGHQFQYMYFLVSGKLKIYTVQENGKLLLLRFNKPLSIVGDMEFLTDYRAKCNVESLNKSLLISIRFEDLLQYAYDDPKFLRFLIKNLCHKLYTISNATSLNLLYPVENRFASYLLSTLCYDNESLLVEELKTSKLTEIANLLGTSYRHLNRIVSRLVSEHIIRKKDGSIMIEDIEKLRELSRNNLYE
ncbi:MAG: Crp/Fnr family transcriptional regulator [Bacillota bacterium]